MAGYHAQQMVGQHVHVLHLPNFTAVQSELIPRLRNTHKELVILSDSQIFFGLEASNRELKSPILECQNFFVRLERVIDEFSNYDRLAELVPVDSRVLVFQALTQELQG